MNFRHEVKNEINRCDILTLRSRLENVMSLDSHCIDGKYTVRSLYFDNLYDKALLEKLNSVNMREKFRIRYYNGDLSYIVLEKKSKMNGLCRKEQARLSLREVNAVTEGDTNFLIGSDKVLLRELGVKMIIQGLTAKTIVDYTREAFVYPPGNVRVTLDYDIRTSLSPTDFLCGDCITIPAGDAVTILEVKWDEFLPLLIRDIVSLKGRRSSSFSKYAVCRIYG